MKNKYNTNKILIILEGADASGKSSLCKHLQDLFNGKCHVMHSNFNKSLPKENHKRQHTLMAKACRNFFKDKNYTGNNLIIFDRCYVSDISYGTIGYGSGSNTKLGTSLKYLHLLKLFSYLNRSKDVEKVYIYCRPSKTNFNTEAKEELLNDSENKVINRIYDTVNNSKCFKCILKITNFKFYTYNFNVDPDYKFLDNYIDVILNKNK